VLAAMAATAAMRMSNQQPKVGLSGLVELAAAVASALAVVRVAMAVWAVAFLPSPLT
jgi:hypothetical protein